MSADDDEKKPRPIDEVFWTAWVACQPEVLKYALRFADDRQGALELIDEAFDAILSTRPWREGTELVDHIKGCIKSIAWNERVTLSELELRRLEEDEDPDPAAPDRSPEEEAIDNERSDILRGVGQELLKNARPGSLEDKFLRECAKGIEDIDVIAANLGVTRRQIIDSQKGVRRKARQILKERGYALGDKEEDDGDDS